MSIVVTSNQPAPAAQAAPAPVETVETKPAAAEVAETVDTSEGQESEVETVEAAEKPVETEGEKIAKGVQKRIDKLTKRNSESERRAIAAEERARLYEQQLNSLKNPQTQNAQQQVATSDGEPQAEKFEKHADYVKALAAYSFKQERGRMEQAQKEQSVKADYESKMQAHQKRLEPYVKATPDFQDVIEDMQAVQVPRSFAIENAVLESENGPELLYSLGKDLEEYKRICNLPYEAACRAIGRFEAKLDAKKTTSIAAVQTSNAPTPIKPVGGSAPTVARKSLADIAANGTQAEYEARRREQIKKRSA